MTHPIISVQNLSKAYRLGLKEQSPDTLVGATKSLLTAPVRNFRELSRLNTFKANDEEQDERTLWALRDVSFDVAEGEVVGIIGRNGAGKSTLLKVLSRITEPTSGRAVIRGRVSSLLEVGTGFHPELSGRDNIYMNGTILGMTKREIDSKFDEIVDFSGVEKFLDTPIKRYSSGMQVRLAFSVAAHLEPEILIVDEVLAVGDMEFQKKCLGKMKDVASSGRTVLFVSHNMTAVRTLCETAVSLQKGDIEERGPVDDVVDHYLAKSSNASEATWVTEEDREAVLAIERIDARLDGQQPSHRLHVNVGVRSYTPHERAFVAVDIFDRAGSWLMQAVPTPEGFVEYSPEGITIEIDVELPPLVPGQYPVGVWLGPSYSTTFDKQREAVFFTVNDSPTKGRTVPHHVARGYIVPVSRASVNQ